MNEDGWEALRLRDLESGKDLAAPAFPRGARPHVTGFRPPIALSDDGSHVAAILSDPRRPPELWVAETGTGAARAVTESRFGVPREDDLLDVELISYPTFDGRDIPAWLYRPEVEGRLPVVLSIHGGPEAQERPIYHPLYQYLASRGIAVLATNIRGSTGYGKTYQRLVQRDWGGGDMKDWDHAVKWLHEQDWVDADRIGVFGGSYGGFAVLTCVTRLPDYWAAAVDIVGPSNLITFAKAVPPTWRRMMKRFVGDPEEDADLLRERSPMTYIENVKTPLLVIQGAKDPRVVKPESDQLVDKLQSLGREVEYVVFEDEGHGFTKRPNEVKAIKLSADWLERHLTGSYVSQPTPSRSPSKPCGSVPTTLNRLCGTSAQSRSGGYGGMQTPGYDGSQPLRGTMPRGVVSFCRVSTWRNGSRIVPGHAPQSPRRAAFATFAAESSLSASRPTSLS